MKLVNMFRALGERNRLRMVLLLERGPLNVSELVQILGLSQSNVSHHLKQLVSAGLLRRHGRGNWAFYSVRSETALVDTVVRAAFDNRNLLTGFQEDMNRLARCLAGRKKEAREFFNSMDEEQLSVISDTLPSENTYLPFIKRNIQGCRLLLEVGSGNGRMIPFLLETVEELLAVDSSSRMLELALKNTTAEGLSQRVKMRLGEAEHLPVENQAAGAVLMHMVLHHCGDPGQAIMEAFRVLKPGGTLVVLDLLEHEDTAFRSVHGDLWPGFSEGAVTGYLRRAGFDVSEINRFENETVLAVAGSKGDTR